jgi:hypothetical protein
MPTVPGPLQAQMAQQYDQTRPTPEQLLITAADMNQRGQLHENPTTISDPRAPLKLPGLGGGRGPRPSGAKGKRR